MTTLPTTKPSGLKHGTPINTTDINVVGRTHEPVEKYSQDIQVGDIITIKKLNVNHYEEVKGITFTDCGNKGYLLTSSSLRTVEHGSKVWVFVPYINKPSWYKG